MAKKNRKYFRVELELPKGKTVSDAREYVRKALLGEVGGDFIEVLNRDSIYVRSLPDPERPVTERIR